MKRRVLDWTAEDPCQPLRNRTLARAKYEVIGVAKSVVPAAVVEARVKSACSIRNKMRTNRLAAHQVLDTLGIRVIVPETGDCYRVIEQIHALFEFIVVEYDDYIRSPKAGGGYCSLHTTLVSFDSPVEIQVRTWWMHALSERGAASHWRYKQRRGCGMLVPS